MTANSAAVLLRRQATQSELPVQLAARTTPSYDACMTSLDWIRGPKMVARIGSQLGEKVLQQVE